MPNPMRRTKSERKAPAHRWLMGVVGLYIYDNDPPGVIRNWEGDSRTALSHASHQRPSFPLRGDNVFWMFRKTSDVSADSWRITEIGTGTQLALQDERGGVAKATLGASDDDYQYYFSRTEIGQILSSGVVTFGIRIRVADVDQADMFVGLCQRLASGTLFDDRQNALGFYLVDGSAGLCLETRLGGTAQQSTNQATLVDDTYYELGIAVHSNPDSAWREVNFFLDGVRLATHTTYLPTTELGLAFGLRNGEAAANEISVKGTAYVLQS